jgi:uncharacterized Fe-S cluster protein YjdI/CDGSH-type Zn-finger protein
MRKVYRGKDIEVSFDLDVCIHVGECLRGHPTVFKLGRRPWILPDEAPVDEVAAVVEACPSGALMYRRLDGGPQERSPDPPQVTSLRNGPLLVRGRIEVRRPDGQVEVLPRATLCRCGLSQSKPFCDNSHLRQRFEAEGQMLRVHISPLRTAPGEPIMRRDDPRREA